MPIGGRTQEGNLVSSGVKTRALSDGRGLRSGSTLKQGGANIASWGRRGKSKKTNLGEGSSTGETSNLPVLALWGRG